VKRSTSRATCVPAGSPGFILPPQDTFICRRTPPGSGCERAGLDDLARNPRFNTVRKRAQHASEIVPLLRERLKTRTALEWETVFGDAVPCSAVRAIEEMFDHPQVASEDIIAPIPHPVLGYYRGVTRSIKFSRTPGPDPFAAPLLGQDNQ
jgi:crotonobetainyl-CoA:carnitine CoA-transferase CaiB-like acyl-CoA transferase